MNCLKKKPTGKMVGDMAHAAVVLEDLVLLIPLEETSFTSATVSKASGVRHQLAGVVLAGVRDT